MRHGKPGHFHDHVFVNSEQHLTTDVDPRYLRTRRENKYLNVRWLRAVNVSESSQSYLATGNSPIAWSLLFRCEWQGDERNIGNANCTSVIEDHSAWNLITRKECTLPRACLRLSWDYCVRCCKSIPRILAFMLDSSNEILSSNNLML